MQESQENLIDPKVSEIINPEFQRLLNSFLEYRKRTSRASMITYRSAIQRFIKFANVPDIQKIEPNDADSYLEKLDSDNYKLNYKVTQLDFLRSFFEFVKEDYRRKKKVFLNPFPTPKFYSFSPDAAPTIKQEQKQIMDTFYTIDQLLKILDISYKKDYMLFIQIVLLTFCGMRVSENVSIYKDNLKLKERYLKTGVVKNARKTSQYSNGIYYCFPEVVADHLFEYQVYSRNRSDLDSVIKDEIKANPDITLYRLAKELDVSKKVIQLHIYKMETNGLIKVIPGDPYKFTLLKFKGTIKSSPWLFPSPKDKEQHIGKQYTQVNLKALNLPFNCRTHKFRHTIATYRKRNNIPRDIREALSNHAITSIEDRNYAHYTIEDRRRDYDETLPRQYDPVIKYLESLL